MQSLPWRQRVEVLARNQDQQVFGGQWQADKSFALPGGGVEGDETPTTAALRELFEETGLRATNPQVLPIAPIKSPWSDAHRAKIKRPFAGSMTHFVVAETDGQIQPGERDVWSADQQRFYSLLEALQLMQDKKFMSPATALGRLAALQYLLSQQQSQQSG